MRLLRHRPSHALVVAYLALVVALGGTSYAAVKLPKNSVGSKQIKVGAVKSVDVKEGTLRTGDVRDDSLTGADISESTLAEVPRSGIADQVEAAGVGADALANGAVTARALGPVTIESTEVVVGSNASKSEAVGCPSGSRVISGGTFWTDVTLNDTTAPDLHIVYSRPSGTVWQARGFNGTTDVDAKLVVYAVCLT